MKFISSFDAVKLVSNSMLPYLSADEKDLADYKAQTAILRRLGEGAISTRCRSFRFDEIKVEKGEAVLVRSEEIGLDGNIPNWCWHVFEAPGKRKQFEWLTGDFYCQTARTAKGHFIEASFLGVEFDASSLPVAQPSSIVTEVMPSDRPERRRGRPPANWWPDFAEELTVYVHENGLPPLKEELIRNVFAAMSASGKTEPSRSQIQSVVDRVFDRLAKAGN